MKTEPLTPDERRHLDEALAAFVQMAEDAGQAEEDGTIQTAEAAGELLIRWEAQPPKGRLPLDVMATITGAALGEHLREILRLKWAAAGQGADRSIGLASEIGDEAVLSPFDLVRDGLREQSAEAVIDLFEELPVDFPHLLRN